MIINLIDTPLSAALSSAPTTRLSPHGFVSSDQPYHQSRSKYCKDNNIEESALSILEIIASAQSSGHDSSFPSKSPSNSGIEYNGGSSGKFDVGNPDHESGLSN